MGTPSGCESGCWKPSLTVRDLRVLTAETNELRPFPRSENQRETQGGVNLRGRSINLAESSHDSRNQKEGSKGRGDAIRIGRRDDHGQLK